MCVLFFLLNKIADDDFKCLEFINSLPFISRHLRISTELWRGKAGLCCQTLLRRFPKKSFNTNLEKSSSVEYFLLLNNIVLICQRTLKRADNIGRPATPLFWRESFVRRTSCTRCPPCTRPSTLENNNLKTTTKANTIACLHISFQTL